MKNSIGDHTRLLHILDAISEIEKYVQKISFDDFIENTMVHSASIRQLEIIGESASRVTHGLKKTYKDIDWENIIGLRNILIHEYFGVDLLVVWEIIEHDLPLLKNKIQTILKQFES
ncbi:MAG: DUF86 domain-containing protein [bacterium]